MSGLKYVIARNKLTRLDEAARDALIAVCAYLVESQRDSVLEQAAKNLAKWYPDNVSINAFCAAIRSMKSNGASVVTSHPSNTEAG